MNLKVKWIKHTVYSSSTERVQGAGDGILVGVLPIGGNVEGVVVFNNAFITIPITYLEFVPERVKSN